MKIHLLEPLGISEELLNELAQPLLDLGHEFKSFNNKTTEPDELYERAKDADIVMIANTPLSNKVIKQLDKTQLINVAFTGVDHLGWEAVEERGILVANASGYANQAVAELSIGLCLSLYRNMKAGDYQLRKGDAFPGPMMGREIKGKTVGIIGTGAIGIETARLYQAFGAKLLGYNRSQNSEALELGLDYQSLDNLLVESDIVTIHLPLTEETRHLIGARELEFMKESAILINVARGAIVDNQALAQALNHEKIAGAGIDVFDQEPPLSINDPLLSAKNCILSPHIGFLTEEAMEKRARIVFNNTLSFIEGNGTNILNQ